MFLIFWLILTFDLVEDRCIDDTVNNFHFLYYWKQVDYMHVAMKNIIQWHTCLMACVQRQHQLWSTTEQINNNNNFICIQLEIRN